VTPEFIARKNENINTGSGVEQPSWGRLTKGEIKYAFRPGTGVNQEDVVEDGVSGGAMNSFRGAFRREVKRFISRVGCGRSKDPLALDRLRGCRAPKPSIKSVFSFHQERRPHLLDQVWIADLEDAAGDGFERHLKPDFLNAPKVGRIKADSYKRYNGRDDL
jgi:hypothetical protein